ncbi:unnamed protein product [Hymenolepis diminuta]|uniref:Hydroxyproline-rich glycoprotein family protein n=1 Tax=Hymenolepis diminuta TaxID=6216 RepID=A0A0R3SG17_HYMDI|nr:unnamed protein product [Hymenolepis diminuta]
MQRLLDIREGSPIKVMLVNEKLDDHQRHSTLHNLNTSSPFREISPLKTVIQPSPPNQQPLPSQEFFSNRKEEEPESVNFNALLPNPPLPLQPNRWAHTPTSPFRNRPQNAPKLGPKPTIQWPPRIRPGSSDKPKNPPMREFCENKQSTETSGRRETNGGGISQAEGSYEVIWDYFSENGGETEEERIRQIGESEEEDHWDGRDQFYGQGIYEPSCQRE